MSDLLEYKGYHGTVEYSAEDNILFGSVFGIKDSISYHGSTIDEIQLSFKQSIDDYLSLCEECGIEPDKEFRGSFNVRVSPELHKEAALSAVKYGMSLNSFIQKSIEHEIYGRKSKSPEIVQVSATEAVQYQLDNLRPFFAAYNTMVKSTPKTITQEVQI